MNCIKKMRETVEVALVLDEYIFVEHVSVISTCQGKVWCFLDFFRKIIKMPFNGIRILTISSLPPRGFKEKVSADKCILCNTHTFSTSSASSDRKCSLKQKIF